MKLCKAVVRLVLVLSFCALAPRTVLGENNPLWATAKVYYMIGGGGRGYECWLPWEQVGQDPGGDPEDPSYDGCRTTQGHGFVHMHFSHGFPFETYNEYLDEVVEVTAAMSDTYWNLEYFIESNAWHYVSGSTLVRNCHGYATDRTYWVNDIGTILDDDWNYIQDGMPKASCINSLPQHSWKVPEVYVTDPPPIPWGWDRSEKVRIEKNGSSGVYFFDKWLPRECAEPPYYEQP